MTIFRFFFWEIYRAFCKTIIFYTIIRVNSSALFVSLVFHIFCIDVFCFYQVLLLYELSLRQSLDILLQIFLLLFTLTRYSFQKLFQNIFKFSLISATILRSHFSPKPTTFTIFFLQFSNFINLIITCVFFMNLNCNLV